MPRVQELRQNIPLSSWVQRFISLKKKGNLWWGLCPFHKEKSPSFSIDDLKGHYHCFGCQSSGDLLDFVQNYENLSFKEALERLDSGEREPTGSLTRARPAPLKQKAAPRPPLEKNHFSSSLLKEFCQWSQDQLRARPEIQAYFHKRGIEEKTLNYFQIGFCPDIDMLEKIQSWGYSLETMVDSGLAVQKEKRCFFLFRQRLMFPIWDVKGNLVAFGGRCLPESLQNRPEKGPKYINSPTHAHFRKGSCLYGALFHPKPLRSPNMRQHPLILVEGYMDVLALHQIERLAFAPLGTAVDSKQLQLLLSRSSMGVMVCMDTDRAGQSASFSLAQKALEILTPSTRLHFAALPPGNDPCSFLQNHAPERWDEIENQAIPLCQYLWENLDSSSPSPEQRARNKAQWTQWVESIPHTELKKEYQRFFYQKRQSFSQKSHRVRTFSPQPDDLYQKLLLGIPLLYPEIRPSVQEYIREIKVKNSSLWLQVQKFLLSWNKGDLETSELSDFQKPWTEIVEQIYLHLPNHWPKSKFLGPSKTSDAPSLENENFNGLEAILLYWFEMFNCYQIHHQQSQEISQLKKNLWNNEQAWRQLQTLSCVENTF